MTDAALERVLAYVESELSFSSSHYNERYLERRIASRMRRTRTDSAAAYLERLREDPDEQAALLETLSISVTGFFRNPDVWEGIREVLAECARERSSVDVWSVGCADGREAYSLAMLAHADERIDPERVSIVGTDISESALQAARAGVYHSSRTVNVEEQLAALEGYDRYVTREDTRFEVDDRLRELVRFRHHDVITDGPLGSFDVVVCRNLFIYIDPDRKAGLLETIRESLSADGYLVIGKTETIPPPFRDGFETEASRLRIYRRTADGQRTG